MNFRTPGNTTTRASKSMGVVDERERERLSASHDARQRLVDARIEQTADVRFEIGQCVFWRARLSIRAVRGQRVERVGGGKDAPTARGGPGRIRARPARSSAAAKSPSRYARALSRVRTRPASAVPAC